MVATIKSEIAEIEMMLAEERIKLRDNGESLEDLQSDVDELNRMKRRLELITACLEAA